MPRGPTPKPRDQLAGNHTKADLERRSSSVQLPGGLVELPPWVDETKEVELWGGTVEVPEPPTRLLKQSRQRWATWWCVPEAAMLRPQHVAALERLIRMYDEEERLLRRIRKKNTVAMQVPWGMDGPAEDGEEVVEYHTKAREVPGHLGLGSQGQLVQHPDWKALQQVRGQIQSLEDRFAGTPLAEFRLGWQHAAMLNEQTRAREARQLAEASEAIADRHEELLDGE